MSEKEKQFNVMLEKFKKENEKKKGRENVERRWYFESSQKNSSPKARLG